MQIKDLVTKSAAFDGESYSVLMQAGAGGDHMTVDLIQKDGTIVTVSINRGVPRYVDFKGISGALANPVLCGQTYMKS